MKKLHGSCISIKLYGEVGVPKGEYNKLATPCTRYLRQPAYTRGGIEEVLWDVKTMTFATWIRSEKYYRKYIRFTEEKAWEIIKKETKTYFKDARMVFGKATFNGLRRFWWIILMKLLKHKLWLSVKLLLLLFLNNKSAFCEIFP